MFVGEVYIQRKIQTHTRKLDAHCEAKMQEVGADFSNGRNEFETSVFLIFVLCSLEYRAIQTFLVFPSLCYTTRTRELFLLSDIFFSPHDRLHFQNALSVFRVGAAIKFCIFDEFTQVICFIFAIDTIPRKTCIEKIAMQDGKCWHLK